LDILDCLRLIIYLGILCFLTTEGTKVTGKFDNEVKKSQSTKKRMAYRHPLYNIY